jgi:hypothetical protein
MIVNPLTRSCAAQLSPTHLFKIMRRVDIVNDGSCGAGHRYRADDVDATAKHRTPQGELAGQSGSDRDVVRVM